MKRQIPRVDAKPTGRGVNGLKGLMVEDAMTEYLAQMKRGRRNAIAAFGLAAGAIVVALVAYYGYVTSDTPTDGTIIAFFFAVIAIGGIAGPAFALHVSRSSLGLAKLWGALAGMLAIAALLANLSNSLGAIADRAERAHVADARRNDQAERDRVTAERAALHFTPTTKAAVTAAREAMMAAEAMRIAECRDRRAKHCKEHQADLAGKRDAFAAVLAGRAETEQAEKLDAEAASIRARLDTVPVEQAVNRQAAALGRIFRLPDADAVTWQQVATVVAAELLIAFSLITWELLRVKPSTVEIIRRAIGRVPMVATKREPADSRDVATFVLDCMRPAGGETVELRTLYSRFLRWCDAQQLAPLPPAEFSEAFKTRCEQAQIDVRREGRKVQCFDVKLTPVELWRR